MYWSLQEVSRPLRETRAWFSGTHSEHQMAISAVSGRVIWHMASGCSLWNCTNNSAIRYPIVSLHSEVKVINNVKKIRASLIVIKLI